MTDHATIAPLGFAIDTAALMTGAQAAEQFYQSLKKIGPALDEVAAKQAKLSTAHTDHTKAAGAAEDAVVDLGSAHGNSARATEAAAAATVGLARAKQQAATAATGEAAATAAATAASARFLATLKEQAATYGKSKSEVMAYRAAQHGMTQEAAQHIAALKAEEAAQKKLNDERRRGSGGGGGHGGGGGGGQQGGLFGWLANIGGGGTHGAAQTIEQMEGRVLRLGSALGSQGLGQAITSSGSGLAGLVGRFSAVGAGAIAVTAGIGAAGYAMFEMAKHSTEAADELNLLQGRMQALTKSAESGKIAVAEVFKVASETGQKPEQVANTITQVYRNTPLSVKQSAGVAQMLGEQTRLAGLTPQQQWSSTYELNEALSLNNLGGRQYRTIQMENSQLLDTIAEGLGKSKGQLKELSENGELSAAKITLAFVNMEAKIHERVGAIPETFKMAENRLENEWTQMLGRMANSSGLRALTTGIARAIADGLHAINDPAAAFRNARLGQIEQLKDRQSALSAQVSDAKDPLSRVAAQVQLSEVSRHRAALEDTEAQYQKRVNADGVKNGEQKKTLAHDALFNDEFRQGFADVDERRKLTKELTEAKLALKTGKNADGQDLGLSDDDRKSKLPAAIKTFQEKIDKLDTKGKGKGGGLSGIERATDDERDLSKGFDLYGGGGGPQLYLEAMKLTRGKKGGSLDAAMSAVVGKKIIRDEIAGQDRIEAGHTDDSMAYAYSQGGAAVRQAKIDKTVDDYQYKTFGGYTSPEVVKAVEKFREGVVAAAKATEGLAQAQAEATARMGAIGAYGRYVAQQGGARGGALDIAEAQAKERQMNADAPGSGTRNLRAVKDRLFYSGQTQTFGLNDNSDDAEALNKAGNVIDFRKAQRKIELERLTEGFDPGDTKSIEAATAAKARADRAKDATPAADRLRNDDTASKIARNTLTTPLAFGAEGRVNDEMVKRTNEAIAAGLPIEGEALAQERARVEALIKLQDEAEKYTTHMKDIQAIPEAFATGMANSLKGAFDTAWEHGKITGKEAFQFLAGVATSVEQAIMKALVYDPVQAAASSWAKSVSPGIFSSLFGGSTPGGSVSGSMGGGSIGDYSGSFTGGNVPFAHGGVITTAAHGMVMNRPRLFPMANGGAALAGEAGDEAIMPLKRGTDGKLGVAGGGGGGGTMVQIFDQRSGGGAPVQTSTSTGPDGQKQVAVLIRDATKSNVSSGNLDADMNTRYGIQPQVRQR